MAKKDHLSALRQVSLFQGLSDKELRTIASDVSEELFSARQDIVVQGAAGGPFFLIIEGRAKIIVDGRSRGTLGPGASFGEIALIDQGPRSATIRTETQVKALRITSWDFLAILQENWNLARKVMIGLCQRVRALDKSPAH